MRSRVFIVLGLTILLGLTSPAALAQKKGKGGGKKSAGEKVREFLPEAEIVFAEQEQALVKNWFRDNRSGLPPGLAKRDRLPPGLERQLQKRGKLPPGLEKKLQPLPPELERQMRKLPTGYRRVAIAGHVILMNEKTATIYDMVRNVIP
jgi:hypothetical protein